MIGERLSALRTQKGLSQSELARRIGVSRSLYNKYERANVRPSDDIIQALAMELNSTYEYVAIGTQSGQADVPKFQPKRMLSLIQTTGKDNINELAAHAGVDVMTYTHWFTGKAEPPPEKVERIAEYFDVTSDYLMGLVNDPKEKAQKKEASLPSDMDEKEALRQVLIKAGIIPADRDLTPEEAKILFGAAKGVFDSFGV